MDFRTGVRKLKRTEKVFIFLFKEMQILITKKGLVLDPLCMPSALCLTDKWCFRESYTSYPFYYYSKKHVFCDILVKSDKCCEHVVFWPLQT